ncbi:putative secreted protein [Euzebya pacifica]|uniref:Putative secreted protein n=1 Tax=Euzebya pacifica TaxID=1608957 RepID=A0A346Y2A8_9ACTN|nr:DUF305 domain-containing protein [Euzebya pacifica]AXV08605.1 putative secreted protein [Euzebya pacifica]
MPSMPPRGMAAALTLVALLAGGCTGAAEEEAAAAPRIIQPGAPGEPNREITAAEAAELTELPPPTLADLQFMVDMHPHHTQALGMTALVEERTASEQIPLFAERMDISQVEEIRQIEDWLASHGVEEVPTMAPGMMAMHDLDMPGMLTPEEFAALEAADGEAFDRLFLESMTRHHLGAIQMVEELLAVEGNATDPRLWEFAQHVLSDQSIEIDRMQGMLAEMDAG